MSYADELNNISRKLIQVAILKLDYCSLEFGVDPCLATGVKCYNTYATCKYRQAYAKIEKEYRYATSTAAAKTIAELNAKPYIESIEFIPTEVSDEKTIPARCNIKLKDEPDTDIGIDKYAAERESNILDIPGLHFRKLIERNPNYRGRTVEIYEGFEGLDFSEYKLRGVLKISAIKRSGTEVTIECVDLIKALEEVKYPIRLEAKITQDVKACYRCKSEEEMLGLEAKKDEYALRTDFGYLDTNAYYGSNGTLSAGQYIYAIVGYDQYDNPVFRSDDIVFDVTANEDITIDWGWMGVYYPWVTKYRVYRKYNDGEVKYTETTQVYFYDNGAASFTNKGEPETEGYRLYRLTGDDPAVLNNWEIVLSQISVGVTDTSKLPAAGYVKIEDEVIYYSSKDATNISGVKRLRYNTKAETAHYAGTNIYSILYFNPGNPFDHLLQILSIAGYDSSRIETAKLTNYANNYAGINFSLKPIIKETDLAKIVMNMINALDGKLWVNENGKIDFRYNTEITPDHTINDTSNIILGSVNVEYKQEDIVTRIICYYDMYDSTKSFTDKENYQRVNVTIDADAEGDNEYGESYSKEIMTMWVNSDCGEQTDLETYINNLLKEKLKRMRTPRPHFSFDIELKDAGIKTGDVLSVSTDEFNNIDGTDYSGKLFEVIKKDIKGNKITITARYIPTDNITADSDNGIRILEQPEAVSKFTVPEVRVTNLKYIDADSVEYSGTSLDIDAENIVKLAWDNMYMSQATQATDINGLTRNLPKVWVYTGYPPAPHHQEYNLSSWKSCRKYKVYMFIANKGLKYSAAGRPSTSEANGKWYLVATVTDRKITDVNYRYTLEYPIPLTLAGRYIAFDVYVEANIEYDPNSPVSVQIPIQGVAF